MIEKNANKLINLISEIDEFKGNWVFWGKSYSKELILLRQKVISESANAIGEIENKITTDELQKGRIELLSTIFDKYGFDQFDLLDEIMIKDIHQALYKYSNEDAEHRGYYKKHDVNIDGVDASGKALGHVLDSVSPLETPAKMAALVELTNYAFKEATYHPLVIISLFVLNFLSIQPFQRGNVVVALLVASYLLDKKGYSFIRYSSLEKEISNNLEGFYYSILKAQKQQVKSDILFWVVHFVKSLKTLKEELNSKISHNECTQLHPLSQKILDAFQNNERIDIAMLQELTKANRNTLKIRLRELVEQNFIIKYGNARATYYIKPQSLESIGVQ